MNYVDPVKEFLHCETPEKWVQFAITDLPTLLIDHANCEKKAASTALNLMYRYTDQFDLLNKMSKLAREELRHFEQVIAILKKRSIEYVAVSASRYASALFSHARKTEPGKLVDSLIIGAIIEARSCERFYCLIPYLDQELAQFYSSLLKSESRHFQDYLKLAQRASDDTITERVDFLLKEERKLIETDDDQMRFHSGIPKSLMKSCEPVQKLAVSLT